MHSFPTRRSSDLRGGRGDCRASAICRRRQVLAGDAYGRIVLFNALYGAVERVVALQRVVALAQYAVLVDRAVPAHGAVPAPYAGLRTTGTRPFRRESCARSARAAARSIRRTRAKAADPWNPPAARCAATV